MADTTYRITFEELAVDTQGQRHVVRHIMDTVAQGRDEDATEVIGMMLARLINSICDADEPWPQGVVGPLLRRVRDLDEPFEEVARLYEAWSDNACDQMGFKEYVAKARNIHKPATESGKQETNANTPPWRR